MEIGPGFGDKVALGLASLRFRGTILLVEPNLAARAWAAERYRQVLPRARVEAVPARMQEVGAGRGVDALLANHVLDDLLLDGSVPSPVSTLLFSTMRPDSACSPLFVETWSSLLARSRPAVRKVAREIEACIAAVRPRVFAFNHYASWRHAAPPLAAIHALGLQTMEAVQGGLGARRIACAIEARGAMRWLTSGAGDGTG
jgi:hypothetical protein